LKSVLYACVGIVMISLLACSQNKEEKPPKVESSKAMLRDGKRLNRPFHGDVDATATVPGSPVLMSLKKNHLEASATKTIGEAFDNYKHALKKEWRETPSETGSYFIDYICWLDVSPVSLVAVKEGVVKRALDIKFAIGSNGETYIGSVSRIDIKSDGMVYTTVVEPADIKKIVTAIYENREIPF